MFYRVFFSFLNSDILQLILKNVSIYLFFVFTQSLQHGDTIYPPTKIIYPYPTVTPALPKRYKDHATMNIKYLDVNEGMSSSYVYSILGDKRGNLWISTYGGVSCYDGISFKHFAIEQGFGDDYVWSILEDRNRNLWFATEEGVKCYDGESISTFTTKQGLSGNDVYSIYEDKKGNLWFGTLGGGVSCFDGHSFTNFTTEQGLCNNRIYSINEDESGNIWFGTRNGVSYYDGNSFVSFTKEQDLSYNRIRSIIEDRDGKLWFGTDNGVKCYDGKSITYLTTEQGLRSNNVRSIIEDRNGNLWIGTRDAGVSCYNGQSFINIGIDQGLNNNWIRSIYEDKSGNIWFSWPGGGVSCYYGESFTHFTSDQGLGYNWVWSILEDKRGKLWFGTGSGGLSCFDGKSFSNYTTEQGLKSNWIYSILEDNAGKLWFGTGSGGVSCYDEESFTHFTTEEGLAGNSVFSIYEDKKGNLWFGTRYGVSCYDGQTFTNYTTKQGLSNNRIYSINEDKNGNLWLGTDHGLSCYDGINFTNYSTEQGLRSGRIRTITKDENGNLWIGTEGGGINVFNGESFTNFTNNQGLSDNRVQSILMDNDGNFWIGTLKGLNYLITSSYFAKENAKLQHKNNAEKNTIITLGNQDGLISSKFNSNANCLDSKNRIWWGTEKALTMLNMDKFSLQKSQPQIQLNSIVIQQNFIDYRILKEKVLSSISGDKKLPESFYRELIFDSVARFYNYPLNLELPYKLNHLAFHFSAIDWAAPHKLKYQYKLEGFDKIWNELSAENKADYRNIPYGEYVFKVKAIGAARKWSDTFEYSFVIHPPWWHTWWARTFYVIVGMLLIWLIIRWRTMKLKQDRKRLEQTVKERTQEIEDKNVELQEQNEEITSQRDKIDSQHKSIADSILYAKRIQTAVLPTHAYIDVILPENFILFKPRDKVSGDFYWVKQISDFIVIAVADCTGHGVPGAIMSMLGVSFINEIVQKREITQPAKALNQLRKQIKQALRQTGRKGEADDGMDMALCALDTKTNILQYAGANNSLYLIQNGELKEIKADKMPIGYYPNEKPSFSNHEIQLNDGDIFYMFSDGYIDQFGGKKGFKYKAPNFQKILMENHNKPMIIQKEMLEDELKSWMKGYEQTDDILVMGVRV